MARVRGARAVFLKLLGAFEARLSDGAAIAIPGRKAQALVAYLAVTPGRRVGREILAGLLWGDADEATARNDLRQLLFAIRRSLGPRAADLLVSEGDAVALSPAASVDVADFERGIADRNARAIAASVDLYRGDFLEGLSVDAEGFEAWLSAQRERLRELLRGGLARLAAHHAKTGDASDAVACAQRLLTLDPLDEASHRLLMRLYADAGQQAAALRQYQVCLDVLRRELGVEPDEETRALYRRVLGRRRAPARDEPPPSTRLAPTVAPLIGRDVELGRLREALDAAWGGAGQVVALLGEAGIGKSRLVGEIAADAERRGGRVMVGACQEMERALPLHPWIAAVRDSGALEGVARTLPRLLRVELARWFPEIEPEAIPPAGSDEGGRQAFEAFAGLLVAVARRQPLVILLEDLHWSDDMSLRFLSFLAGRIERVPVLVALTAREEETADVPMLATLLLQLERTGRFRRLALAPLGRPEVDGLVSTLVPGGAHAAALEGLRDTAWAASEGNPFVAVEVAHAWGERADSTENVLPRRVHELVELRLGRLGERAQEMIATAAVMGGEFDFALLARATGWSESAAAETLEELVRSRVLRGFGERFGFLHQRIRDVAYHRLLPPRRRLLHRRVAEAAEALYVNDLDPHAAVIGTHYRAAEAWERAVTHLRRAGAQAYARGAHRDAATSLQEAIDALDRLAGTDEIRSLGIDLRFELRQALFALGDLETFGPYIHDAVRLCGELDDRARLGRALVFLGHYYHWQQSDHARGRECCEQALAMARADGEAALATSAGMMIGLMEHFQGRYVDAAARFRGLLAGGGEGVTEQLVHQRGLTDLQVRSYLCASFAELGEFDEGYALAEQCQALADRLRHPFALMHAAFAWCGLATRRGDFERVAQVNAWYQNLRDSSTEIWQTPEWWVAYARALSGDPDGAIVSLEAITKPITDTSMARPANLRARVTMWLGEAYLLAGRHDDAAFMAAQAIDLAHAWGQGGYEAWAHRLQGEIAASRAGSDVAEAEASFARALGLAQARRMRPLEAHCHLGLGRLLARSGRAAEARVELTAAGTVLSALGMPRWLGEAESALATLV